MQRWRTKGLAVASARTTHILVAVAPIRHFPKLQPAYARADPPALAAAATKGHNLLLHATTTNARALRDPTAAKTATAQEAQSFVPT